MHHKIYTHGISIIELLIYVAILAVIGVVLSGYFVAALNAQSEHDHRDDLANGAQNITAALRQDAAVATQLLTPSIGATSSSLMLMNESGATLFQVNGSIFQRISGSSTAPITNDRIRVRELWFGGNAYVEPRLGATTTSVQYHVLLEHLRVPGMVRSVDGTLLIGKDIL
jgi:type II secretory pathway pseudopilin PulG